MPDGKAELVIDDLKAMIKRLKEILADDRIQWGHEMYPCDDPYPACPFCLSSESDGHEQDCAIGQALIVD